MSTLPLDGLRVVELPAIGPVPFCGMQLADMGADVIRIDRVTSAGLGIETAPEFDVLGRGKRSLALDLKDAADVAVALRLVATADVLIEGFRPGVAERLGLGPEHCHTINPRLVYGRIPGFGRSGPKAASAGHDIGYLALSGLLSTMGTAAQPIPPLNLVGDFGGAGMSLTSGVLAALLGRDGTGSSGGVVVDASILGGATALSGMLHGLRAAELWTSSREDNLLDGGAPYYRCYATRDGGFFAVGAIEPRFYAALLERLGLADEIAADAQNDRSTWPATIVQFSKVFAMRSRDEWTAHFEGHDACCEPVLSLDEAVQHPQAMANEAFVQVAGVTQPAPFPAFTPALTPAAAPRPAPAPGQHTAEVLAELAEAHLPQR